MKLKTRMLRHWHEHRVESIFIILACFFGLLFLVIVPPTQSADETTHFYRAYQFTDGKLFSVPVEAGYGATLPRDVYNDSRRMFGDIPSHYEKTFHYKQLPNLLKHKINQSDTVPVHAEGAAVYSPAGYMPQMLAIMLAKIFWPSTAAMYYLGRACNLILWTVLVYIALRMWPGSKWPLFVLALLPMSISQAASFSPDATMNGLAFLIISWLVSRVVSKKLIGKKEQIVMGGLITLLAFCKPIFFILGLLLFALKANQLGGKKRKLLYVVIVLVLAVSVTAVWNAKVGGYADGIRYYIYSKMDINEGRQLAHIVTYPLSFMAAIIRTFFSSEGNIIFTSFIGRLGWWEVDLPIWMVTFSYLMLALSLIGGGVKPLVFEKNLR